MIVVVAVKWRTNVSGSLKMLSESSGACADGDTDAGADTSAWDYVQNRTWALNVKLWSAGTLVLMDKRVVQQGTALKGELKG